MFTRGIGTARVSLVAILMILGILAYEVAPLVDGIDAMTIETLRENLEFARIAGLSACVFGIPVAIFGLVAVVRVRAEDKKAAAGEG